MKKFIAFLLILACMLLLGGCGGEQASPLSREVTILMYHHFEDTINNYTVVAKDRFREQLTALKKAGYETVTLAELIAFVEEDGPLPEKPLLITMDDGYTSNLTVAAPILEEFSMSATVFVIGMNEGQTVYAHSGQPLDPPRFAYAEAQPWIDRGVLEIQSHTYDLHQRASYGFSGREGVLRLEGESDADYKAAVLADCKRFKEARAGKLTSELVALAYPYGFHTPEIDAVLESEFKLTVTTKEHTNIVTQGDASTLRMMGRFNVSGELTGAGLVERLQNAE